MKMNVVVLMTVAPMYYDPQSFCELGGVVRRMIPAGQFVGKGSSLMNAGSALTVSDAIATHPRPECAGPDVDDTSFTAFRSVTIDVEALAKGANYDKAAVHEQITRLIRDAALSVLAGNGTLPAMVMIECVNADPKDYMAAFEKPVVLAPGVKAKSVQRLTNYVNRMDEEGQPVIHRAYFSPELPEMKPNACECFERFNDMLTVCSEWIDEVN